MGIGLRGNRKLTLERGGGKGVGTRQAVGGGGGRLGTGRRRRYGGHRMPGQWTKEGGTMVSRGMEKERGWEGMGIMGGDVVNGFHGFNGRDGSNGYNLIAMIWQHTEQERKNGVYKNNDSLLKKMAFIS